MSPSKRPGRDKAALLSLVLIAAVVVLAWISEGGQLRALLQPTAALVVFGGTAAALLLSFPVPQLRRTARALKTAFRRMPEPELELVNRFEQYAVRVRRRGAASLEPEIAALADPFLSRAIGMVVDGVAVQDMRHALTTFNHAAQDADEECALVLETAAGYAPTLGILGAVLGLIRVMESLATPAAVGAGIAVAFVATVYGVGSANLILLPLAARLRANSRNAALAREVTIEGSVVLRQALHPRVVEAHLAGFVRTRKDRRIEGAA